MDHGRLGEWLLFRCESCEQPDDPTVTNRFLTAVVKGEPNQWAIRDRTAASGSLSTYYNGTRPAGSGYNPMSKEGAVLLGIGGDNSNGAQGAFYDGVTTSGYPPDATDGSVQANIVAAKYVAGSLTSGPAITVDATITFKATTPGYTTRYLAHSGSTVNTQVVSSSSTNALQQQASWTVRTDLANSACVSFECRDIPDSYIRHNNFVLLLNANDGTKQFHEDATSCPQTSLTGSGTNSVRAWGYPTRYFRHYANTGYIASNEGPETFDAPASFNNDMSWMIGIGFV